MTHNINVEISDMTKLLKENKYLVVIKKTKDGCVVEYPAAKLLKRPKGIGIIRIDKEKNELAWDVDGETGAMSVDLQEIPLSVEMVVMQMCDTIVEYAYELSEFRDEDGEVISYTDFFKLFN